MADQIRIQLGEIGGRTLTKYVPDIDPATLLIGQGKVVQEYDGKFPHPIEGYLPNPVVLVGFPFDSLTKLGPDFDAMVYRNGRFSCATGVKSENKWHCPNGSLALYLEHRDLYPAQMPLTRYGGGATLELFVDIKPLDDTIQCTPEQVDEVYHTTVEVCSVYDIKGLASQLISVTFPFKWDRNGTFYGNNRVEVLTKDGTTYVITHECLPESECELLKQMIYTARKTVEDPGLKEQFNTSLADLANYM